MPSTPVCGRAAMPRPAPSAATTPIRIATRMASRSWRAGTTPGWSKCPVAARVGRRRCGCAGCGRGRTSTWWPPSRSAPGCGKPRPPRRLPADLQLRRRLRLGPAEPGLGRRTGLPAGPLAGGPLLLRRSDQPTPTGRPRRHGAKFVCNDPPLGREPTDQWSAEDPEYGHVQLQAWSGLHPLPQQHAQRGTRAQPHARPLVRGTLIRLEVQRLPRPTKTPVPLWFWWWAPTPPDLAVVWQAYIARFSIEHTFRFFKQTLKWTTPKLRRPEAADRWTWLLLLAYVQLRLARDLVADVRLPWQRPLPPERRTPARVRRGFSSLLTTLGSPVNVPKPCGRSPGRPKGKRSQPAQRFPAVKLTP